MVRLKHKSELLAAQLREFVLAQGRNIDTIDDDAAGGRGIESGNQP